uniref:Uncharacterized protein n=1 Tax=Oryza barthii TaxID=65489 RepID=A0A0D3FD44_9ORYZ
MHPVIAETGYAGTANTDGFLFSDSALHNVYPEDQFSSIKQLHPWIPSTTGRSSWLEEKIPVIHQRTSAAASSDIGSSVLHKPSLFPSIIDCFDKEPVPIHQSDGRYSYDSHLSHLTSCSTSLNYGLSMPSVAASPVLCGMKRIDPSPSDPVLKGRFLQYANPCRFNIGHFDSVQDEQKDHAGFQTAYRHCSDWNRCTNDTGIVGNYLANSSGETCNVGENSITGRFSQEILCSEVPMSRVQEPLSHHHSLVQEDLNAFCENITYRCNYPAELIKSMYNLSVALISSCNGDYELDESYQELIQSAIQNLSSLSPKRSKNLSIEENKSGNDKDAHVLAYKNLWIEAEASMCKLKYELQLARMELALKYHSQQSGAPPTIPLDVQDSSLSKSKSLLCDEVLDDPSKQQNHVKENTICSATLLPEEGNTGDGQSPKVNRSIANEVEAGVFTQLRVLRSRGDSICSFGEGSDEEQQETSNNKKTNGFDNTAAVSMDTLKSGDDSMNSVVVEPIKERVESSKTDVDTAAPFYSFVKRLSGSSSSSDVDFDKFLSSIKKQTDVTVMARHKDFVCDKGNIRSLDDTTNQCQAASNTKQLEDDALRFFQSLKIPEGIPEDHSDDGSSDSDYYQTEHYPLRVEPGRLLFIHKVLGSGKGQA